MKQDGNWNFKFSTSQSLGKVLLFTSFLIVSNTYAITISDINTTQQLFEGNTTNVTVANTGDLNVSGSAAIESNTTLSSTHFVYNDGNVTSTTAEAIKITGNNDGNITNTSNGKITAANDGILVTGNSTGMITNSGTLNAVLNGIKVTTENNGTISNTGSINLNTSNAAYGINVSTNNGNISNSGTITTTSSGNAVYGIKNTTNDGNITNSGTITATSSGNVAYGINVSTNNGNITNSSSSNINVTSTASAAYGVQLSSQSSTGSTANAGTITVNASTSTAYGIQTSGTNDGNITNSGTIDVNGTNAYGFYVPTLNGNIINSGTITAKGTTSAYGIYLSADNNTTTNSGEINATYNGATDYRAYSVFANSGTGDVNNTSTGKLYGNIKASTLTNSGTIVLPWNANSSTTSASVTTLTLKSGSTLTVGLNTGADGNVTNKYSQVSTTTTTIETGVTINVNVLTADGNQSLLKGKTLSSVISATTLNAPDTLTVTDNSALLSFTYVKNATNIDLSIGNGSTILASTSAGGGNTPAQSAATALDTINSGTVPSSMTSFFTGINSLATDAQVAAAADSTTPTVQNAANTAIMRVMDGMSNIVSERQNVFLRGLNSGDAMLQDQQVWIKPFGGFGKQEDKDGIHGFDMTNAGVGMGYDAEIKSDSRLGIAGFINHVNADVRGVEQNAKIDVYSLMIYGNAYINEETNLLYQASYSWQDTHTTRQVTAGSFNQTATANYTPSTASVNLKLLQTYQATARLAVSPLAEMIYRYYDSPAYSESGASGMNLDVKSFNENQFILGLGALANYMIDTESRLLFNVNVDYDTQHNNNTVTAAYAGAPTVTFNSRGIDNGGWIYNAGIGASIMDDFGGGELELMYNFHGEGTSFYNNVFSAKYTWKF